jgi:hypothetical protein
MKLSGWIFMIISWSFILSLGIFCFSRIFKKRIDLDKKKSKKKRWCK